MKNPRSRESQETDLRGSAARPSYRDNAKLTDPGTRGGDLGSDNDLPEGGDSTRFSDEARKKLKEARSSIKRIG